jgi:glycine cleavage system H protein
MSPDDRNYSKSHQWLKNENDLIVIGITDHAQSSMGDVTYVDLPPVGRSVQKGEPCGVIESVKTVTELQTSIAGEIAETNGVLASEPGNLNDDPYGQGWLFKLKNFDRAQLDALMSSAEYEQLTAGE